jgi:hypothetical protein
MRSLVANNASSAIGGGRTRQWHVRCAGLSTAALHVQRAARTRARTAAAPHAPASAVESREHVIGCAEASPSLGGRPTRPAPRRRHRGRRPRGPARPCRCCSRGGQTCRGSGSPPAQSRGAAQQSNHTEDAQPGSEGHGRDGRVSRVRPRPEQAAKRTIELYSRSIRSISASSSTPRASHASPEAIGGKKSEHAIIFSTRIKPQIGETVAVTVCKYLAA